MDNRTKAIEEILSNFVAVQAIIGKKVPSLETLADVAYDRLLPLMTREFPEEAVRKLVKDLAEKRKEEWTPSVWVVVINDFVANIKRLWERKKSPKTFKRADGWADVPNQREGGERRASIERRVVEGVARRDYDTLVVPKPSPRRQTLDRRVDG